MRWLICIMTFGLLAQVQGEFVFYDTFQAGHDTDPNTDYASRQIGGLVESPYTVTWENPTNPWNNHRIYDNDGDEETALTLRVYKPLGGVGDVSWTASRAAEDLGPYLSGGKYTITLDSQFFNGGGNPAGFDTAFAVGILWSAGATTTPMTSDSIFGIRLNGTGGGFGIYTNGNLVIEQSSGTSVIWMERFELKLLIDEMASTVQVLVQGVGEANATDLGTYTADFTSHSERIIQLYGSQKDNGSGAGGYLKVDTFEMEIFRWKQSAYEVWSNNYALAGGPYGDDDLDGLANLYEFGVGGDPTNAADQGVSPEFGIADVGESNVARYVHPQLPSPDSGLNYNLELSRNLVLGLWTNSGYVVAGTNITGSTLNFVTNDINAVDEQKFIRLCISEAKILHVDDFGALGNGVHDDTAAVVDAIEALKEIGSGGTLEFATGKTYKFGLRADSNYQIDLQNMTNATVNGNGAMLLNTPWRASIRMQHCDNVTVKNLLIDQEPLGYTQGVITDVSVAGGYFEMDIMDGYDLLPVGTTTWAWGSVIDPVLGRIRWDMRDHFTVASYTDLGAGSYRGYVEAGYVSDLNDVQIGDVYFQPFVYNGYADNIHITNSKDCLLENVTLYSGRSAMSCRVDLNTGRITVRGFNVMIKPGTDRLVSNWRDGVHCKDNRIGPIIEDCYFEALLDDSINLSQNTVMASEIISSTTFRMTKAEGPTSWTQDSSSIHLNDRIMVFYPTTGQYVEPIRVVAVDPNAPEIVTFESPISNVITGSVRAVYDINATHFYNLDMCNAGYIVRNNTFRPQRRHAILARSIDGLIEGNLIEEVGGNGILMENEFGNFYAGPFPQNVVISNNTITSTHLTPVKINARSGSNNTQPIRDIEITANVITAANAPAIELNNVQEVTIHDDNEYYEEGGGGMLNPLQITNSKNVYIE